MEDVDAAFHNGMNRTLDEPVPPLQNGAPPVPEGYVPPPQKIPGVSPPEPFMAPRESASKITLSGLLNALDGGT